MWSIYSNEEFAYKQTGRTLLWSPNEFFQEFTAKSNVVEMSEFKRLAKEVEGSEIISKSLIKAPTSSEPLAITCLCSGVKMFANQMFLTQGILNEDEAEFMEEEELDSIKNYMVNLRYCGWNVIELIMCNEEYNKFSTVPMFTTYSCFPPEVADHRIIFNEKECYVYEAINELLEVTR